MSRMRRGKFALQVGNLFNKRSLLGREAFIGRVALDLGPMQRLVGILITRLPVGAQLFDFLVLGRQ